MRSIHVSAYCAQPTHPLLLLLLPLHLCLSFPLSFSLTLSHIQLLPLDHSVLYSIQKMPLHSLFFSLSLSPRSLVSSLCFVLVRRSKVELWAELEICWMELLCCSVLFVFLLFSCHVVLPLFSLEHVSWQQQLLHLCAVNVTYYAGAFIVYLKKFSFSYRTAVVARDHPVDAERPCAHSLNCRGLPSVVVQCVR